jgi:4-aminobutyrate aminotransferase-like enzyme
MIDTEALEAQLMELSWPDAPSMVTEAPGPKVLALMEESAKYESFTRGGGGFPVILEQGKGVTVKDADGNMYIDMAAGVAVNAVGRNHPKVLAAIQRQCDVIMHTTDITNPKRIELAKKVSGIMPEGLAGNCHTAVYQAGSDAVETAIKFARAYTGRTQLMAFHGAYHGVWCGTAAMTTSYNYRHGWGPLIAGVQHLPYAYCYRCPFGKEYPSCDLQCGKYVDDILNGPYTGADDVAAVVIESQQGEGGYVAPPPEFLETIKAACEKNGCLYIADEVQSGAGRTGKMWAIQHSNVVPDMLTWGKGMGGDMPMAGVTYRSDMEGAARGLAAEHLRRQRDGLRGLDDQHRPDHRPGDRPDRPCRHSGRGDQGRVHRRHGERARHRRRARQRPDGRHRGRGRPQDQGTSGRREDRRDRLQAAQPRHPHDALRPARQRVPLHAAAHDPPRVRGQGDRHHARHPQGVLSR